MPRIHLRPATTDAAAFIYHTYRLALRNYVEWAWGWDETTAETDFWRGFPLDQLSLIELDGQAIGTLCLQRLEHHHYLRTFFLAPARHGQGIGSAILTRLTDEARSAGKPLVLKVIRINPARRLYERHGFRVIREEDKVFQMQWG